MKRLASVFIVLAVALILQACGRQLSPESSCNFVQNSQKQRVSWKNGLARMYIHESVPREYFEAIYRAAEVWNQQIGREVISIEAVVGGSGVSAQDGYNIIYYMKTWDEAKASEQARTTIYWSGDRIYEADVRINGSGNYHLFAAGPELESGKVDMESLIIHEFGHVLGLAHTNGAQESVMQAFLSSGIDRREVTEFDDSSLSCEYGKDQI